MSMNIFHFLALNFFNRKSCQKCWRWAIFMKSTPEGAVVQRLFKNIPQPFLLQALIESIKQSFFTMLNTSCSLLFAIPNWLDCNKKFDFYLDFLFLLFPLLPSFFDCCKQSLNRLYHPSIHPSSTRLFMGLIPNFYFINFKKFIFGRADNDIINCCKQSLKRLFLN